MTAVVRPGATIIELCQDADKFLEAGELGRATSLYMCAFRTHAASTVSHMRNLARLSLDGVISTLECWLDSDGEVHLPEGLNRGLVAVFLSTLCPNNISATIFKMESLLLSGGHGCEEISARCTALLDGKRNPYPEGSTRVVLEITRALACLFSEPQSVKGLNLYLKAFHNNKTETITLVKSRQAQHLSIILKAFTDQILHLNPSLVFESKHSTATKEELDMNTAEMLEFVLAISPGNVVTQELQAAHLFLSGRFGESIEMYSVILQQSHSQQETGSSAEKSIKETLERRARLLTARAAACFSAGDRTLEACQDLGKAFQINPATTQVYFQKLFTDKGTGMAARNHLCQQAERGLSGYRERVTSRPDLRSTDGVELLDPVITQLRTLCHLEPDGGGRELRVRLTDCLLLRGEHKEALSICGQLAASKGQQSYQNTVRVLRGYARLLSDDHKGALEDFQAVIGHSAPHPSSCVRALCGRGLLRMLSSSYYLAALDYVTASRLQPREAALTVRCLVPWNCRGLLFTVLLEQGRVMLEGMKEKQPTCSTDEHSHLHLGEDQLQPPSKRDTNRTGYDGAPATPAGVQSLAALLMELQPSADGAQILAADALYQLGRVEEAYRLLLAVGPTSPRAPILARLTLLQLHRGFLYDTNQLLKKLIQCGDTSCLCPLLAVAQQKDRALLQGHCHSAAKRILDGTSEESAVREAVAYLSIAIMASGGEAADSLLERARCYALLGQRKTAIFDFSTILKENPKHVQALCGRGFTYLMLNQQKECTEDILVALHINSNTVTKDILSLKDKAQKLVCDWMHQLCRSKLSDVLVANAVPCQEEQLRETFVISTALMTTDCRDPRWHLLHVDILLAKGEMKAAAAHLVQVFGQEPRDGAAQARVGVVEAWQQNYHSAAHRFSKLIEKDPSSLEFLLDLIPLNQQKRVAQAAAQEASSMSSGGQWDLALPLLTVAVQVTGNHKLQYLRQRAACLAQLGLHEQAVADLDRVIQKHSRCESSCSEDACIQAEDLCRRGRSHVLCSRQGLAVEDFSRALELHRDQAIRCIEAGLGRQHVSECFLRGALQQYGEQQLSKAWAMIESGLLVDGENTELRGLRAKVKREVSSPCIVG
ncbi:uncharacterized protein LOC117511535 [Thalassophryne amazonica]|uniref:uncharacterized protein LOC117511535 n=1 Tax=Thalassophryne amazonica TaxID=390379 RepID=UPI0014710FD7|nr:uncharacterized protein LOC117511535 [Thalassophryne amazonica]